MIDDIARLVALFGSIFIAVLIVYSARLKFSSMLFPVLLGLFGFPLCILLLAYLLMPNPPPGDDLYTAIGCFFWLVAIFVIIFKMKKVRERVFAPQTQPKPRLTFKQAWQQAKAEQAEKEAAKKAKAAQSIKVSTPTYTSTYRPYNSLLDEDDYFDEYDDALDSGLSKRELRAALARSRARNQRYKDEMRASQAAAQLAEQKSKDWILPLAVGLFIGSSFFD